MAADAEASLATLRVDGGAATNDLLLSIQADLLDAAVERPVVTETTALGAAYLAGVATGFWSGLDEIRANWQLDRRFEPSLSPNRRLAQRADWARAVERSRGWAAPI